MLVTELINKNEEQSRFFSGTVDKLLEENEALKAQSFPILGIQEVQAENEQIRAELEAIKAALNLNDQTER